MDWNNVLFFLFKLWDWNMDREDLVKMVGNRKRVCLREFPTLLPASSHFWDFSSGSDSKASACSAQDLGSIPRSGRSPGEGNGTPLQYPCLENPMDRGAWWAAVYGVAQSWAWLKRLSSSSRELEPYAATKSSHTTTKISHIANKRHHMPQLRPGTSK